MSWYRVKVSGGELSKELNWPVNTIGEAKAFIEGYKIADMTTATYSFKVMEIRHVGTVVSFHIKEDGDNEARSHASEEEAEEYLEDLKKDGLFDEVRDDYEWHFVTVKTEHEVMIGGEDD